jgi:hypothetical protein
MVHGYIRIAEQRIDFFAVIGIDADAYAGRHAAFVSLYHKGFPEAFHNLLRNISNNFHMVDIGNYNIELITADTRYCIARSDSGLETV